MCSQLYNEVLVLEVNCTITCHKGRECGNNGVLVLETDFTHVNKGILYVKALKEYSVSDSFGRLPAAYY